MIHYLSISDIFEIHTLIISQSGGSQGLRDFDALESSLKQIKITFNKQELYPDIISKAASLCYSLVMNHPFVDGNKRIGHAAMETFLILNGYEIRAEILDQEKLILELASGQISRDQVIMWLKNHTTRISTD